ncbi:MAG: metal-sensitive transcriptional regulator [Alphaproteobacteria bacterium]|nr:metal-sensitive transcriptional regulator [Alphaproteobacteria bacterium]
MHPSHHQQLGKLNRITGQIDAVKRMIDEQKYCVDIITQVRAARNALKSVELSILETHMKHCLDQATPDLQDEKMQKIITLLKKYE